MKNKIQIETRSPCLESLFFHRALATVLLLAVPLLISCGGGGNSAASSPPPPPPAASAVSVTISPKNLNNLPAGGTQAFNATVTGSSNQAVIWSVREGAWCGSVTTSGTYLAPNSPGLVCHVVATSQADATKSDTAEIMVSPISMYVLPFEVSLGVGQTVTFAANVQGTNNTKVTWTIQEGAAGGSITDQGVYTAPQGLGTFHVIATSQADPRFTAPAKVNVVPIAVTVSPNADTLGPLGMRTFAASVVGTIQTVSWSIQEGTVGGSITSGGAYTAPQTLGTFHVLATSQADATASGKATVTVVPSGFTLTSAMHQKRALHRATLLNNGTVLITGGGSGSGCNNTSAELYDAADASYTPAGSMSVGRAAHTATLLSDGKVLITGGATCALPGGVELFDSGDVVGSAELYDPTTNSFVLTGGMTTARQSHTSTLLASGKVLITGGGDNSGAALATAELYDPASGTFTSTGSMQKSRVGHSATSLANGKVLIAGGYVPACTECLGVPDNTAELYDPATGVFALTGSMAEVRAKHTATLLTSGQVLTAGGDPTGINGGGAGCTDCIDETNQAELYDPNTGTFTRTGDMMIARASQSAVLLSDGKVLIGGGVGGNLITEAEDVTFTAELYDPATKTFAATGSMASARTLHTATLLANGTILVTGGFDQNGFALLNAELYK